jgi:hypothetical protein
MTKRTVPAVLAALTLVLATSSALASTGYATRDLNVRDGAGTGYDVVGHISKGDEVECVDFVNGWCELAGGDGYVAGSYLKLAGDGDDDEDDEDEDEDDDVSSFDPEDGTFDDDPLDFEDSVPQSIRSGYGDDDDD